MQLKLLSPALVALLSLVLAAPLEPRNSIVLTGDQLKAIVPKSASCSSSQEFPNECQTAAQAAGPISASFSAFGITTPGAAAALISTMASETGDFSYCIHHFPGPNPGQGTRNMQLYKYQPLYAKSTFAQSIPAFVSKLPAAQANGPDALLALIVSYPTLDFGSAAWFLKTYCGPEIVSGLAAGTQASFAAYVECTGATMDPQRMAYFTTGLKVLGGSSK